MFIKSINNTLPICDKVILLNYKLIHEAFKWVIELFKKRSKKIRWIILSEAPLSYSGYFYNPVNENYSAFMQKSNIEKAIYIVKGVKVSLDSKYDAILQLVDYEILIIDIYPLPLPAEYYKKTIFYDAFKLNDYWVAILKVIQPIVNKSTKITHRYKRLLNNPDAKKFVDLFDTKFGTNNKQQQSIASKNMGIAQKEFDKLFK